MGIVDALPKSVVYRLLAPALRLPQPVRLICREDKGERLLEDLAVIARADRRIDAREREALCDLAFLLDIDPDYVSAVLDGVRGAMD